MPVGAPEVSRCHVAIVKVVFALFIIVRGKVHGRFKRYSRTKLAFSPFSGTEGADALELLDLE